MARQRAKRPFVPTPRSAYGFAALLALVLLYLFHQQFPGLWSPPADAGRAQASALARPSAEATVQRVVDGDTVVLAGGERLRYIGVNTPELHHPHKPVEHYAREAKEFNRSLVEGKKVRLEFDVQRRDKFQRLLAYVYLEDGTFVNAELLRNGYAQIMTIPPNVKHVDLFLRSEREAREANRGLWGRR